MTVLVQKINIAELWYRVHYCIVSKISSCIPAHSRRLLVVARPGASADGNVVHSCSAAVHVCGFAKHQTVVSRAAAQQIRYCRRSRCAGKTRTAEEAGMLAYFFLQLSAVMSTEIFSCQDIGHGAAVG